MKLFIASDIHGSKYYAQKLVERFEKEKADKLILLGDIYYHGPRNPLPKDYAPMEVANLLNPMADKLIVIQGNCDSEVDQMISKFHFVKESMILLDGKKIMLTHGHILNKDNLEKGAYDVLAYGHFHINMMEKKDGVLIINPGSVSLPKENSISGYITIENNIVKQFDIEGNIIQQEQI
ncbi:MAG: phosphodiesterase [Clostridiales bacterium]|nr:phosphodiesterase [Clostridiales bacterium]